MTPKQVKKQRQSIDKRLAENEAERLKIKADLLALQKICQHPTPKKWTHRDYIGDVDHHWSCPDCGLSKIT